MSVKHLFKQFKKVFLLCCVLAILAFAGLFVVTSLGWFGGGQVSLHEPVFGVDYKNNVIFSIGGRDASDQTLHERAENLAKLTHTNVIQISPGNFPDSRMEEIKSYFYRLAGTAPFPVVNSIKAQILKQLKLGKKVYLIPFSAGNFYVQKALEELKLTPEQNNNLMYLAIGSPVAVHKIESLTSKNNYQVLQFTDPRDGLILCSQKPTISRTLLPGAPPSPEGKVLLLFPELLTNYLLNGGLDKCNREYKTTWLEGKDPHVWEGNYEPLVASIYLDLAKTNKD